jgi:hypothetical protein
VDIPAVEQLEVEQMTGRDLVAFVRDIRTFAVQLADLLGTADKIMGDGGWELATAQNVAHGAATTSLNRPREWFPYEVFRFYRHEEKRHVIAFVSALLDDDREGYYRLTEPLLSAGWFDFPGGAPHVVSGSDSWWSRFHGYMDNRRDDGTMHSVRPKEDWAEDHRDHWYPFDQAHTFAVPLVQIDGAALLQKQITVPLLARIHEARPVGP